MIYNPAYTYKFQLKTTLVIFILWSLPFQVCRWIGYVNHCSSHLEKGQTTSTCFVHSGLFHQFLVSFQTFKNLFNKTSNKVSNSLDPITTSQFPFSNQILINRNIYLHCQKTRILFMEVSKYVCPFHSLGAHFYLAKAIIKEKIWWFYKIHIC